MEIGSAVITYGNFIQAVLNFLIMALVVFCLVKAMNRLSHKKEQTPPPEDPPAYTAPNAPARDTFDKATGLIGRLIQRYGWLLGVRVALSGLGVAIIGALARWGFGAMFGTVGQMMDSMGGFGGMGGVEFSPNTPPELQRQILEELGLAPAASPLGGIEGFFLGFATVLIVIGLLTLLAGIVLAVYLYQKGTQKP